MCQLFLCILQLDLNFFSTVTVTFGDAIFPDKAVLKNKKLLKENATKLINQIYDIN